MKYNLAVLLASLLCVPAPAGTLLQSSPAIMAQAPAAPSGLLFSDGFESGNFSHTENNFVWVGGPNISVSTAIAYEGTHSVRFAWGSGSPGFSELRWNLQGIEYPEVWVSWYQFFPTGSEGVGPNVSRTAGGNNKVLRLFGWDCDAGGDPLFCEQAPRFGSESFTTTPSGNESNNLEAALIDGDGGIGGISGTSYDTFLSSGNKGRWVQFEWHFKTNSSHVSPDGQAEFWVDGTLVASYSALNSQLPASVGIGAGYLWGSQNGAYVNANTMTYVDNFKLSVTGRTGP